MPFMCHLLCKNIIVLKSIFPLKVHSIFPHGLVVLSETPFFFFKQGFALVSYEKPNLTHINPKKEIKSWSVGRFKQEDPYECYKLRACWEHRTLQRSMYSRLEEPRKNNQQPGFCSKITVNVFASESCKFLCQEGSLSFQTTYLLGS